MARHVKNQRVRCSDCGKLFQRHHPSVKYCSEKCVKKGYKKVHEKAMKKYRARKKNEGILIL